MGMTRSQRDFRALRVLLLVGLFGWLGRDYWWDNYVDLTEERSKPRRWSQRGRPEPRRSLELNVPELPLWEFDSERVKIAVSNVESEHLDIRITEIHYHPDSSVEEAEFLELTNFGTRSVLISGWEFHKGISYLFPSGCELASGESAVICKNLQSFQAKFGKTVRVFGEFEGGLRNSGERLRLRDARGESRSTILYSDAMPWPIESDGGGASLQLRDARFEAADPSGWTAQDPLPGVYERNTSVGSQLSVFDIEHQPNKPGVGQEVTIRARVRTDRGQIPLQLKLKVGEEEMTYSVALNDVASDSQGLFSVQANLGALPEGMLVRYWFERGGENEAVTSSDQRWPSMGGEIPNLAFYVSTNESVSPVPVYSLFIQPSDVRSLHGRSRSNSTVPVTLIYKGEVFDDLKMRIRGAFARSWPKKAYKIFFHRDQLFKGRSRVNLNSGWRDPAMVREVLAYKIYGAVGGLSLKSRLVRVDLNGNFWGLFVEVEQPDKRFLEEQGLKNASLYKADSPRNRSDERSFGAIEEYAMHYRKETKESQPFDDLDEFCRTLESGDENGALWADPKVRLRFLNYLCGTTIAQNWDGFNKNHYIGFEDGDPHKWFLLPWDLDRTLGDNWNWGFDETRMPIWLGTAARPGVTGWNRVFGAVLRDPAMRREYLARLDVILHQIVTEAWILETARTLAKQMTDDADRDRERWGGELSWKRAIERMRDGLVERRRFLLQQIERESSVN
jgi:hypothetical protein